MIDESMIKAMRRDPKVNADVTVDRLDELYETLEALWKVARAAEMVLKNGDLYREDLRISVAALKSESPK
jgi:hypothetical protein